METNMAENIAKVITSTFKDLAKTETVIGKPYQVGEVTIIPVIKVSLGFGTGGGSGLDDEKKDKSGSGGGGGGGMSVEPIAFLVLTGSEVHLLNMGKKSNLEVILESLPDVVAETADALKLMSQNENKSDEK